MYIVHKILGRVDYERTKRDFERTWFSILLRLYIQIDQVKGQTALFPLSINSKFFSCHFNTQQLIENWVSSSKFFSWLSWGLSKIPIRNHLQHFSNFWYFDLLSLEFILSAFTLYWMFSWSWISNDHMFCKYVALFFSFHSSHLDWPPVKLFLPLFVCVLCSCITFR